MISEFFFQIAELKKLPRSGWKIKVGLEDSAQSCKIAILSTFCELSDLISDNTIDITDIM